VYTVVISEGMYIALKTTKNIHALHIRLKPCKGFSEVRQPKSITVTG